MLKVQYFKHRDIAIHLYDRFLAVSENMQWNDELPIYFSKLFYAKENLGMKHDYTNLWYEYYGTGKGWLYDHKGTLRDTEFTLLYPPLVCQHLRLVSLWLEMDSTSQIS